MTIRSSSGNNPQAAPFFICPVCSELRETTPGRWSCSGGAEPGVTMNSRRSGMPAGAVSWYTARLCLLPLAANPQTLPLPSEGHFSNLSFWPFLHKAMPVPVLCPSYLVSYVLKLLSERPLPPWPALTGAPSTCSILMAHSISTPGGMHADGPFHSKTAGNNCLNTTSPHSHVLHPLEPTSITHLPSTTLRRPVLPRVPLRFMTGNPIVHLGPHITLLWTWFIPFWHGLYRFLLNALFPWLDLADTRFQVFVLPHWHTQCPLLVPPFFLDSKCWSVSEVLFWPLSYI